MYFFFSLPAAAVCLLGGAIILVRSGARSGRALACGLLAVSAVQACDSVFLLGRNQILAAQAASVFELVGAGCLVCAMIGMERGLASRGRLMRAASVGVTALCAGYACILVFTRASFALFSPEGAIALDRLGRAHAVALLLVSTSGVWLVENILRSSTGRTRTVFRFPAVGLVSILGASCLLAIHRLATSTLSVEVTALGSLMVLVGSSLLVFFSIRHRLFELDVFVSRYVVYHSLTLLSMGLYLVLTGAAILGVQRLGLKSPVVVTGFIAFLALVVFFVLSLSPEARARLRFFIDTHFFANKYDYRKEWMELSGALTVANTQRQILHVTAQVVLDSMYTSDLSIWLHREGDYLRVLSFPSETGDSTVEGTHPLVVFLSSRRYFLRRTPPAGADELWGVLVKDHARFLDANRIELAVGMFVGNDLVGFMAVGRERPGTAYGRDDVDLLTAIASQASSALAKAWFAQRLAENKEIDTYNRMSATLLHDLKNAAGHLSLVLQNAPRHMDSPEFRSDMLETIGQALTRIDKVISKLCAADRPEEPSFCQVSLGGFLERLLERISPRMRGIELASRIDDGLEIGTDPEILERILENILVNAVEAVDEGGRIVVGARREGEGVCLWVSDNGCGMSEEFLQERLFRPFQTTKKRGTGLGLWQVKNLAEKIGAQVAVRPNPDRGVTFTVRLKTQQQGDSKPRTP
ncbi:MAG TPA: PEP-CTERM system histidine kinase PrsK [Deltaproteobacteria bacterium]|nr:PEP-CTERM system histidine kinase PrsK [Deltaproteobacteria bacterium]HPP80081.1 PEP-CTERM system histidine kinase PrsK [Deltaproteobacteria bacterium]